MTSGFQANVEVEDPQELFGYGEPGGQLDQAARAVRNGLNSQVQGERRAGKSSLLNCLRARLLTDAGRFVPLYVNPRQDATVRGVGEAYRILLGRIHTALMVQAQADFPDGVRLDTVHLPADASIDDCVSAVERVRDTSLLGKDGVFAAYIRVIRRLGWTVILLIDEYEHLVTETFEGRGGSFFTIRDVSTERLRPGDARGLTYVIAGHLHWKTMDDRIGSPDLNKTAKMFYVGPLNLDDFRAMWMHCVATSEPDEQAALAASPLTVERVFALTGGWPGYAKILGEEIALGDTFEEADALHTLEPHFEICWSGLTGDEQRTLLDLLVGKRVRENIALDLTRRGLLMRDPGGEYRLLGDLWRRFVQEAKQETAADSGRLLPAAAAQRTIELAHQIRELVRQVNASSMSHHDRYYFEPLADEGTTYDVFGAPVRDRDEFGHFALQAYILLFERSQDQIRQADGSTAKRTLARLPRRFGYAPYPKGSQWQQVLHRIGAFRHAYAHDLRLPTATKTGMPVTDALNHYLQSVAEPRPAEFATLQVLVLEDMLRYFRALEQHIRDAARAQPTSSQVSGTGEDQDDSLSGPTPGS